MVAWKVWLQLGLFGDRLVLSLSISISIEEAIIDHDTKFIELLDRLREK